MCAVFRRGMDAASKNPRHVTDGRLASALRAFFGYFLCDKESDPRVSAEALQLLLTGIARLNPSYLLPSIDLARQYLPDMTISFFSTAP